MLLSIIVPCFNEQETVPIFYRAVEAAAPGLDTEIEYLFVDDGSTDGTLEEIKKLAGQDERVHFVSFSRNFGKEAAIYAGIQNAAGDYLVLMDADLQDPPGLLPQMLEEIRKNGYDCVGTRRVTRKGEPPIRSFFCQDVLPADQQIVEDGDRGWGEGLSDDDPSGRGRGSFHRRMQSIFQRHFWVGRFSEKMDRV